MLENIFNFLMCFFYIDFDRKLLLLILWFN